MLNVIRRSIAVLLALAVTSALHAEDAKPVDGTLSISGKFYKRS